MAGADADANGAEASADDDGAAELGAPLGDPPEHPWAISTVTSAMDLNGDPAARIVNP